jgi:hypothetical protein
MATARKRPCLGRFCGLWRYQVQKPKIRKQPMKAGQLWRVPEAFCGETVAIRPIAADRQYGIFFAAH